MLINERVNVCPARLWVPKRTWQAWTMGIHCSGTSLVICCLSPRHTVNLVCDMLSPITSRSVIIWNNKTMFWSDCTPRVLPSAWICPSLSSAIKNPVKCAADCVSKLVSSIMARKALNSKDSFFLLVFSFSASCPVAVYFCWRQLPAIRSNK